jgi:superfamily II DNA or RNA helicase
VTIQMLKPRGYQNEIIRKVEQDLLYDETQRFAVVIPTGGGKTVIFAWLTRFWHESWHMDLGTTKRRALPNRVLILVHRDELVDQTLDKLSQVAPHIDVGIVKAEQNDVYHDVIIGSVQTLQRDRRLAQLPEIGLVIVDECHHASAPGYRKIMSRIGCWEPDGPKAIGFTATLSRRNGNLADVWQTVPEGCHIDILDLIQAGWLADVQGRRVTVDGMTLENVAKRGGDFAPSSLSELLMSTDAIRVTADAYQEYASDRSGIVFTPSVDSAHAFADEFISRGFETRVIHGSMSRDDRKQYLDDARNGKVQVLVNCMVLTEGVDIPRASCAVIARPTLSPELYVQMVGRVLRPHDSKSTAVVLDISGASELHRLATLADLTSRRIQTVQEGDTLTQAAVRELANGNPYLQDYAISSYQVDLFKRSPAYWLQTYEGVWFIATKEDVYFLWPDHEPDRYRVGKRPIRRKGGEFLESGLTFDMAMEWAEQIAMEDESKSYQEGQARLTTSGAAWRSNRRAEASPQQYSRARQVGLKDLPEGISKRDLSDMISIHVISKVLDAPLLRIKK